MFWERRFGILFSAVVLTILVVFIAMRVWAEEPYGEAITLCPGPDLYGYTCTTEGTAEYIDATNDTTLYADDGFMELELPFPFTFYGQTYTTLQASSNGSLTFGDEGNATFETFCPSPTDGVVPEMGDMIAPYWIDLDLTFVGYLEYEVVGTAPERIYVLEWDDIPLYSTGELVTFEVQLHEAGNNIFMLYQNVDLASGRDAVVAIQSEQQGLALTYSCLQPALANGLQLGFLHPEEANPALTAPSHTTAETQLFPLPSKGAVAELHEAISGSGERGLRQLAQIWQQSQSPSLLRWEWADVTADGRNELITFWQGRHSYPQAAIFQQDEAQQITLLWSGALDGRPNAITQWELAAVTDRTGDGQADLVLGTGSNGRALFSWDGTTLHRMR